MAPELIGRMIDTACAVIDANAELLTRLDSEIGDGDHGHNMRRGFQEIAAQREQIAGLPLGQALQKAGMALVMKVGGASGPLYGSLLMSMGKAAGEEPTDAGGVAAMWAEGIEAVKRRGKSDAGEKTMLDVLVPAHDALRTATADGLSPAPRKVLRPPSRCARPKGVPPILASARSAISIRGRNPARC
jgi:phosphoenolpyruvate---glycerone phosphotransferase subunit DhaL